MPDHFRSLRVRLLLPLLAVAILTSIAVAIGSYMLGDKWAREELNARYEGIASTLAEATFPLTQPVLDSLAALTNTELTALATDGRILASTMDASDVASISELAASDVPTDHAVAIDGRSYRYAMIDRRGISNANAARVAVFFDERNLQATRIRAAGLPLVTGLSTVILLTSVTLYLTNRLIGRLSRLQLQVDKIASGNFETQIPIGVADEVGLLAAAVQRMNDQLERMWTTLNRQQGQKLLHQLAGGLAHQLRNSITGARMGVELHGKHCEHPDDSLEVAISQLEQTELHMQRLLIVASGKPNADQPQSLGQCLAEAINTLNATARHLGTSLTWQMPEDLHRFQIADGPSLNAALTNLVLNAMQAGGDVSVSIEGGPEEIVISVADDGAGPPETVAHEIFEPFVTSKPEGLGLGLPLVAQSAKRLGGIVSWGRENDLTTFKMTAKVTRLLNGQDEGSGEAARKTESENS